MQAIESFHPAIKKWFKTHFPKPSPPQEKGWPLISSGSNTLLLAPTGSGKTLAAFLWCLNDILLQHADPVEQHREKSVHTLYISPLKALNNDIQANLIEPTNGIQAEAAAMGLPSLSINSMVRTGDTPAAERRAMLKKPPHILITTPESLYLLLTSAAGREIFRGLRYLIIDEIHAVCNNKRGVHLSVSIERLMPLCEQEPVRIGLSATQKPLQRIADYLGGQQQDSTGCWKSRPVKHIDCGSKKPLDLKVVCPVQDFSNLPDHSAWPAIINCVYDYISCHNTTLVFVNSRAQSERITRMLNDRHSFVIDEPNAEIAQAHHGSLSREIRYDIEARLKRGELPAVIATASLELGIDIGAVDLVIQLGAPPGCATGMQRLGRSGHSLSGISKGRFIPLFRTEIDSVLAMARAITRQKIEETKIPENCLDVLAQHIVAEVAAADWLKDDLFLLLKRSYCYRDLSVTQFNNVLEMLAGSFAETEIRALKPRLHWDRVSNQLTALRGARLTAIMSGGTIPDRGYFGVYLPENGVKLGEVDEEFVFERRVGDLFYLGNNEWKIEAIKQDRIEVAAVRAIRPQPPFWKGDGFFRDYQTAAEVAAFRNEIIELGIDRDRRSWLKALNLADAATHQNLLQLYRDQEMITNTIPAINQIVCEFFFDAADEQNLVIHSPFGGRVNGAWAIALARYLEKQDGTKVQYASNDEGMIFRLPDKQRTPPIREMMALTPELVEKHICEVLADSPVFAIYFRHNAGRALLLPRSQIGKRVPLWQLRLRASDLLQAVAQWQDFPVVLETWRDCLNDVFDMGALRSIISKIRDGSIKTASVQTPYASPLAAGMVHNFVNENLYEQDQARHSVAPDANTSVLLQELIGSPSFQPVVTAALIAESESLWQFGSRQARIRTPEELAILIKKCSPISIKTLQKRVGADAADWLPMLVEKGQIIEPAHIAGQLVHATQNALFCKTPDDEQLQAQILHFMRARGPVSPRKTATALGQKTAVVRRAMQALHKKNSLVTGRLIADSKTDLFCERQNYLELTRRALAANRRLFQPVSRTAYLDFLLKWHKCDRAAHPVEELLDQYSGYPLPAHFFERDILRARLHSATNPTPYLDALTSFKQHMKQGDFTLHAVQEKEGSRKRLIHVKRNGGAVFFEKEQLLSARARLKPDARTVAAFLQENGTCSGSDILIGTGLTVAHVRTALQELVLGNQVTCDEEAIFTRTLHPSARNNPAPAASWQPEQQPWQRKSRLSRKNIRTQAQHNLQASTSLRRAQWRLTTSFSVYGRELNVQQRAEMQARLLLRRHGILIKEWYRREVGLLPWYHIFQALKRLEWQGEIRRGYFVEGLSGLQFAFPEALEALSQPGQEKTSPPECILLSTIDPALPFGGFISWDLQTHTGQKVGVTRLASNHLAFMHGAVFACLENWGERIQFLHPPTKNDILQLIAGIRQWLAVPSPLRTRKNIEIHKVNDTSIMNFAHLEIFTTNGFEKEGNRIILWPSNAER